MTLIGFGQLKHSWLPGETPAKPSSRVCSSPWSLLPTAFSWSRWGALTKAFPSASSSIASSRDIPEVKSSVVILFLMLKGNGNGQLLFSKLNFRQWLIPSKKRLLTPVTLLFQWDPTALISEDWTQKRQITTAFSLQNCQSLQLTLLSTFLRDPATEIGCFREHPAFPSQKLHYSGLAFISLRKHLKTRIF